jgi:transposase
MLAHRSAVHRTAVSVTPTDGGSDMDTMPQPDEFVIVGVDTHADTHAAVVLSLLGAVLGARMFPATRAGYARLLEWAASFGQLDRIGIEGTGSWGRGLSLFCLARGLEVREVDRADRRTRRARGKTDLIDAETAARAVLAGTASTLPKTGDGPVEMIRVLHITRETAVKARTQAINQLRALTVTAPLELAEQLKGLSRGKLIATAAAFDTTTPITDPSGATKFAMRSLARRIEDLGEEIERLERQRNRLVDAAAPRLIALEGVGYHSAAILLIAAGDNPERLRSEATFAKLCAAAPKPASSGKTNRHRLDRGGNRQANRALHTIVIARLRWPNDATRSYVTRRNPQGECKANLDTIRRLKRYIAREVYPVIIDALSTPPKELLQAA